jgi:hypothetical protein
MHGPPCKNDGIVEKEVWNNVEKIQKNMYEISLNPDAFERDLAKEIARIANISRVLGLKMRQEDKDMTKMKHIYSWATEHHC